MITCLKCTKEFEESTGYVGYYCPQCRSEGVTYQEYPALKEVKFCKYCGSKNILLSRGYYKHYFCTECGSKFD